ncbi:DegT/DnrJ/EryC1/StrS family aminotransferase [Clostridium taeniosporum]|uniref:DegT/DnrJ/EryC1/StrS aminotransferase family protein n=1 Tax=Clostridium taeniosporum TaxID=394958 RepID=A0A1D7XJ79_9CLOT|nr:DegT/DnrJ/EryC1/StrS family aminotransferase [Clostridium taeniosporum]AOR23407.1 hypothetical protein BGI42_06505 [Clostridium taeniosporum]
MNNKLKYPIGGEFWFQDEFQDKDIYNNIENEGLLLSGGESAIRFILNEISFENDEIILLPSYLCPTIVELIKKLNIKYKFYNINKKLDIDIVSIENLINKYNVKVVFFIDYFGFFHKESTRKFLKNLKLKNILLIEDAVQKFWIKWEKKFIGDYVFNSYRKFLPIDGSLILCRENESLNILKKLNSLSRYKEANDKYFKFMEKARDIKTKFISQNIGYENDYLNLFNRANIEYYKRKNILKINLKHKRYLNHFPINKFIKRREENYSYVFKQLKNMKKITFLNQTENLDDNTPLVFPILIDNRDCIKKELMKNQIYLPIHWNLENEKWINNFKNSLNISKNILSLPIDWRYEIKDMEFLIFKLKEILIR